MSSLFEDSLDSFLAPIRHLLKDDDISEVMINGPKTIFIEKGGLIEKTDCQFEDEIALQAAVRNIGQFVGRKIDEKNPTLDARLPDGSRIHAVLPPCARNGTTVAIRKFKATRTTLVDLVQFGSVSKTAARFLDICVHLGKNLVVSGGTGSGKTTLLSVLAGRIPKASRLIIIEDSSELQIDLPHCVFFETKAADPEGDGEITIRDLVKSSMRLRPDRIVVGEVRSGEAMDLINVMNTGHKGSMGTVHANSPIDGLVRLETLAMMGDSNTPVAAVRRQIASALDLVVQIRRFSDGSRKVSHISEVLGVDSHGNYSTQDIFLFVQKGKSPDGKILGNLQPTGHLPTFMNEIEVNQLPFKREYLQRQNSKKAA